MPVHLGQIIESNAKQKGFTNKKLGELLNKHEKTVADIFTRPFVSFDYIVIFSQILNTDFLKYYYQEEPFKSFREEEEAKTNDEIQRQEETIKHINEKLALAMEVITAKSIIIEDLKNRIAVLERHNIKEEYPHLNEEQEAYNVRRKAGSKPNDNK